MKASERPGLMYQVTFCACTSKGSSNNSDKLNRRRIGDPYRVLNGVPAGEGRHPVNDGCCRRKSKAAPALSARDGAVLNQLCVQRGGDAFN